MMVEVPTSETQLIINSRDYERPPNSINVHFACLIIEGHFLP